MLAFIHPKRQGVVRKISWLICGAAAQAFLWCFCACGQSPFSFVQLCDPQLCRYGCEHDAAAFSLSVEYINDLAPDFVMLCGDLTDMFKKSDMLDRFLEIKNGLTVPCYCVVGNNDIGDTPSRALLEEFRRRVGPDQFAFDHKGYRFIGVNTLLWESDALLDETMAQDAWLLGELETAHAAGKPIIVAGHHMATYKAGLFQQYGVVAYLCGHLHINNVSMIGSVLFVTTASTCGNRDNSPLGFRLWRADASSPSAFTHTYLPVFDFYDGRDSDSDGLLDAREDANRNNIVDSGETDRHNPDSDDDGIKDGQELTFGLDPLEPDAVSLPLGFATTLAALLCIAVAFRLHCRASI